MRYSEQMTSELFTSDGKRKYLTAQEVDMFLQEASKLHRAEVRTFCMVMAYTGCRISEALELSPDRIDFSTKAITFRTLKQRDKIRHRSVPVPDSLLDALELVHRIRKQQKNKKGSQDTQLWSWGRTQGWNHLKHVMQLANITGIHATAKGLRHGFGVQAAAKTRNPRLVQKWLGHRSLDNTIIYMDAVGEEEREMAARMWE